MSHTEIAYLVLLFVCLLLSAFFSSAETAFISLQRIRVEHMISTKVKGAERISRLIQKPERFLSTVVLGNTFVNAAAAALATALAISAWGERGVLFATIGITVILLIFGETTPKTFASIHAERTALAYARPVEALLWLLSPFVAILSGIASSFTRRIGGTPVPRSIISEEEIRTMISVGHREGTVEKEEAEMLHKVFDFGDRPVREVMVPRMEVVAIEQGAKTSDFLALYAEHPLSRFPVYQENMDNIVGVLSIKDVLMGLSKGTITSESPIAELARPAYFTPESKPIGELFAEMQSKSYRMAVVVDEYGGTAGIASLTRLVEEIVGEVGDELAAAEKDYEIINEYTFQVDGSMRIEQIKEEMGLELPQGDYETVAGFVLHLLGHIPKQGEQLRYKGLKLVITKMRGNKVEELMVIKEGGTAKRDAAPAG